MRITIDNVRKLPKDMQAAWWASLSPQEADAYIHDWDFLARKEQCLPEGLWTHWLYLAGRGAGKTRTGAETARMKVKRGCKRLGLIAPTASDARDVMVEGESGMLAVCWSGDYDVAGKYMGVPVYEPSKRRLTWENGAIATLYSADEPERLRGPQHDYIWADELCSWRRPETWDLAMFGLRLGAHPQAFISTTPKPKRLILDLMKDPNCVVTRGSTYDNRANLAANFFATVITKYEGTRLGQQELMGVVLEESEGALWSRELLDATRVQEFDWLNQALRIVVAVDPATSSNATESNECGIIVAAMDHNKHGYILADFSGVYTPGEWAKKAVMAFNAYGADRIVAEGNQGGEMVKHTIQTESPMVPVKIVYASRGKIARAEPVAALFEQGKAHMVGAHPDLEDQMCVWEPLSGDGSPDRLDAAVWALTELIIGKGVTGVGTLVGAY